MRLLNQIIYLILFFFASQNAVSQGFLSFDQTSASLGKIKEDGGIQSTTFSFINTGTRSVRILSVRTSCGCTSSDWRNEAVLPGDSGKVTIHYNPLNRPGGFKKNLMVQSDASNDQLVLTISGYVEPKPKSFEDKFTLIMGNLLAPNKSLNLGRITNEKPVQGEFEIYNRGTQDIIILKSDIQTPDYIELRFSSDTIRSKTIEKMIIRFDPVKRNRLGFASDNIKFRTSDSEYPVKEFFVISTTETYFPPMTELEIKKAPKLAFDKTLYDFGVINKNAEMTVPFILTNQGQSKLLIYDIQTNCGCTTAKLGSYEIEAGRSEELKVTFDAQGKKGRQYKTVTIFSNDPTAPTQVLTIKAEL